MQQETVRNFLHDIELVQDCEHAIIVVGNWGQALRSCQRLKTHYETYVMRLLEITGITEQ